MAKNPAKRIVQWGALGFLLLATSSALAQEIQPGSGPETLIRSFMMGPFAVTLSAMAVSALGYLAWTCPADRLERIVQWGLLALLVVGASSGYAQDLNVVRGPMETVRVFLTGPFAVTMATIAVAAVGYLYWIGRIDKDVAISVVIGIGIVFGSQQIVTTLSQAVR